MSSNSIVRGNVGQSVEKIGCLITDRQKSKYALLRISHINMERSRSSKWKLSCSSQKLNYGHTTSPNSHVLSKPGSQTWNLLLLSGNACQLSCLRGTCANFTLISYRHMCIYYKLGHSPFSSLGHYAFDQ